MKSNKQIESQLRIFAYDFKNSRTTAGKHLVDMRTFEYLDRFVFCDKDYDKHLNYYANLTK